LARRHWRFVVRDAYGYAIQNAKVNVYLPGTTTVFTGSAYAAASGGSPITNPFTTNAQGEVEAFFDTTQSVDVAVDDNTDTAYRAVDGAGAVLPFTPFTEVDEVHASPADDLNPVVGVTGEVVAALVNPYTGVTGAAGAVGKYADVAHAHPFTALTPAAPSIPKTTPTAGTDTDPAREDHRHALQAYTGKTAKFTTTSDTNEQLVHVRTVAANDMTAGSMFRIVMKGYQTNSTTAITYNFRARWGGLAGTQLFNLTLVGTTTAHTDNPVHLEFLLTVQSIGATGTITCSVSGDECITTATANTPKLVLDAQAAAVTVDTTAAKDLALTVQMNLTTGTPNLEVDNVLIEQVA